LSSHVSTLVHIYIVSVKVFISKKYRHHNFGYNSGYQIK
jgi:hypothetical protein